MTTITELKASLEALDALVPTDYTRMAIAAEYARIEREIKTLEAGPTEAELRRMAIKQKYMAVATPRQDAVKTIVRVRDA